MRPPPANDTDSEERLAGWSVLRERFDAGTTVRCTSVTIDYCVPLASRTRDRRRFLRVEQQSDQLMQGATIEHGSVSTHDGEQLVEFQRVVSIASG